MHTKTRNLSFIQHLVQSNGNFLGMQLNTPCNPQDMACGQKGVTKAFGLNLKHSYGQKTALPDLAQDSMATGGFAPAKSGKIVQPFFEFTLETTLHRLKKFGSPDAFGEIILS